MRTVLASNSPRRKELLAQICGQFQIFVPDASETYTSEKPDEIVMELAEIKGRAARAQADGLLSDDVLVVSADTIVVLHGEIFGKPKDAQDAVSMLKRLSGKTHSVFTGVCLLCGAEKTVFFEESLVQVKKLSDREIRDYVETGSPLDKAGAYGIQDGAVVESYSGSLSNIVGLPVEKLLSVLKEKGYYGKI